MLLVSGNKNSYCPYRDCLGIDTSDGRISWYQLLGVSQASTIEEMRRRYESRRSLVLKNRKSTFHPVWENLLDELDRAIEVLSDPERKQAYDEDLLRRNRQSSMCRLPAEDADEWKAAMHARKFAKAKKKNEKNNETVVASSQGPRELYEPLRMIGDGLRGTRVYEAWEYNLNRRVAVKCLLRSARTPQRSKSFLEEAQFIASISHPNLAEIHTISTRGCFVVMEYLAETLTTYTSKQKNRRCSIEFTTAFLTQALSILKRLHSAGVVHGGLSARSFHLTETGTIKLTDAPGCTAEGLFQVPGPEQTCIAPELLSPETFGEPGSAVDLYMVGFMAFELLAGDHITRWIPKLVRENQLEQSPWAQWHASPLEQIPSLESLLPEIPASLAFVIETLCEKQVLDRFQSADEALSRLTESTRQSVSEVVNNAREKSPTAPARSARQVGGEAPLVKEAKKTDTRQPDLLETLQDPRLLWERIRTDRKFRLTTIAACCMFGVLCVASGSSGSPATDSRITKTTDNESDFDLNDFPDPPILNDAMSSLNPPLNQKENSDADSVEGSPVPDSDYMSDPMELPQAPVPISLDSLQSPKQATRSVKRPATMAIETIPPFPAAVQRADDYPKLMKSLSQLQHTKDGTTRRAIFDQIRELAPDDARVWFLFAAATDFKPEVRDELLKAVELSHIEYTQPLRQLVEFHLLDPDESPAAKADFALARLIELVNKLKNAPQSRDRQFEWEWVGRVIGYLELQGRENAKTTEMLATTLHRILNDAGEAGAHGIERGRAFMLAAPRETTLADHFPQQPRIAFTLCIESMTDPGISVGRVPKSTASTPIPASADYGQTLQAGRRG